MKRRLIVTLTLAAACLVAAPTLQAQVWPTKPVRLLVGFAPGGGTDIVARLLAQKLSELNGQQFLVENRPGATGMIAARAVATAGADGHLLLMGHVNSNAIAPSLVDKPLYDPIKDFAPVTYVGFVPNVLTISSATPARNVQELIAWARTRPNGLSFASPGIGSTNHLAGELMKLEANVPMVHVPYKGSGPAIIDLLGGQVDMNFDAMSSITAHLKSGRMRAIAVTTPKRDPDLPDAPTMRELGFQGFEMTNWYGVMAPAGTPAAIVNKLHEQLRTILQMPDVMARLDELGVRREAITPAQFGEFIRSENAKYRDIGKRANIKMEQ